MFPRGYFSATYFTATFWPGVGATPPVLVGEIVNITLYFVSPITLDLEFGEP